MMPFHLVSLVSGALSLRHHNIGEEGEREDRAGGVVALQ